MGAKMRDDEAGVVLINVLVILALTASVVYAMVSLSELSIARSQRFSAAGQAQALIGAGEASAITALRRDMIDAGQSDHLGEAWAQIGQTPVPIEGGTFALRIEDAQAQFNLNSLPGSGALGLQILQRLVVALDLTPDVTARIAARMAQPAPLERLSDLVAEAGLTPDEVALLAGLVTVLPGSTPVNINTAPQDLLAALTDNPVQARQLGSMRDRAGFLTPADVAAAQVILPPGVGYASRLYWVTVTVQVDQTTQSLRSLLQRRAGTGGQPSVVVIERDRALAAVF